MANAGDISGGITPVNEYSLNRNFYYPPFKKKKEKPVYSPLHKGEIVQGTILTDAYNSIAQVRLPVGSFEAKLHNKLKKGDRLFLKVIEDKPVLNLKVHSVNTFINGVKLENKEILRMLDLPDNQLNEKLIDVFRRQNNVIEKNSVINLLNNLSFLRDEITENKFLDAVIRTIYWMQEANIDFSESHFSMLYPYFQGIRYFDDLMQNFQNMISNASNPETYKLKKICELCKNEYQFSYHAAFFSKHFNSSMQFYNNLKDLSSGVPAIGKIKQLSDDIIEVCDAMHKWNSIADITNVPYNIFITLPVINDEIKTAQLIIQNYDTTPFKGKIKIEKEDPDCDVGTKLSRFENTDIFINITKENMNSNLVSLASEIRSKLLTHNLSLQAFIVMFNNKETDFLPELPKSPARKISVVI